MEINLIQVSNYKYLKFDQRFFFKLTDTKNNTTHTEKDTKSERKKKKEENNN